MERELRKWAEKEMGKIYENRRCLVCKYKGQMKTWIFNYAAGFLIAMLLLFFGIIPGLIFIVWGWGKYKCPNCGAIGKNIAVKGSS
jgi:hypothetical protein